MSIEDPQGGLSETEDRESPAFSLEVFDPSDPSHWEAIRADIVSMELDEWGEEEGFDEEMLTNDFNNPKNVVVVLKDETIGKIIGFTYAEPLFELIESNIRKGIIREDGGHNTAYISDTLIHPTYRGRHLVGDMMSLLEDGLRARGFRFIEEILR